MNTDCPEYKPIEKKTPDGEKFTFCDNFTDDSPFCQECVDDDDENDYDVINSVSVNADLISPN